MASTVKIDLLFTANTQAAQTNIKQLSNLLNSIGQYNSKLNIDSNSIAQASQAAKELQIHLGRALNQDTGKLDLSKLNASLTASKTSLSALSGQIMQVGPAGQQAFAQLAVAIGQAEIPTRRLTGVLGQMAKTMAQATMWQIAYAGLNAITSSFSKAINYAKEFNRALTDIQIVSEMSSAQMANFADKAMEAARALNTTSTEYAKAALIFYQQGLSEEMVEERAAVVIRMAQATGESAKVVSDQMTAIWNNFAKTGVESLEYYADALTALGAATAASTNEISDALEKFAAVADTVGLSYEYAAAVAATVIDKTRQSAETVGTAFKTILARIQDLELGETLEDGLNLGKYAKALELVGVDVIYANGTLRSMDNTLQDLGEKWDTLTEAQQVSLAQTVAGIRQYSQFIAMMDSWEDVELNVDIAENSEGTLKRQADIWVDSIEGASARVEQNFNELYDKILDDEAVKDFTNLLADLIEVIGEVIDSFGGIGGVFMTIIGLFSSKLFPIITNGITRIFSQITSVFTMTQNQTQTMQAQLQTEMNELVSKNLVSEATAKQLIVTDQLITKKRELENASKNLSSKQLENAKLHMQIAEAMGNEAIAAVKLAEAKRAEAEEAKAQTLNRRDVRQAATEYSYRNSKDYEADRAAQEKFDKEDKTNMSPEEQERRQSALDETRRKNIAEHRKAINKQDVDSLAVGKVQTHSIFKPNSTASGEEGNNERAGAQRYKNIMNELDGKTKKNKNGEEIKIGKDEGIGKATEVSFDASIKNFEKLIDLSVKYQLSIEKTNEMLQQMNNITALKAQMSEDEINGAEAAMKKEIEAENTVSQEQQNVQKLEQNYQDAQKMSDANPKDAAAAEAAANAKKELEEANKNLKKSEQELSKIQQENNKNLNKNQIQYKNLAKSINSMEKEYKDLAKQAGITNDQIEEMSAEFKKLSNGDTSGLEKIKQGLSEVGIQLEHGQNEVDEFCNNLIQEFVNSGNMSEQALQELKQKLIDAGLSSAEADAKLKAFANQPGLDLMPSKAQRISNAFSGLATGLSSLTMLISGFKMLSGAFEEGATTSEKVMSVIMGLSMVVGVLTMLFKGLSTEMVKVNGQYQMGIGMKILYKLATLATAKSMSKEAKEKGKAKLAQDKLNAAELLGVIIKNWWLAAAILAVVAIAAITIAVMTNTGAQEANNEAAMEANEQTQENTKSLNEAAKKVNEQASALEKLKVAYYEAAEAGKDYSVIQQDIIKAIPDFIKAQEETLKLLYESGAIDKEAYEQRLNELQGLGDTAVSEESNVEEILATTDSMTSETANDVYQKNVETRNTKVNSIASTMKHYADEYTKTDKGFTVNLSGYDSYLFGGSTNEEAMAVNSLNELSFATNKDAEAVENGWFSGDHGWSGIDLEFDTSDKTKFLSQYEELKKWYEDAKTTDMVDADIYDQVGELINNTKSDYETALAAQTAIEGNATYAAQYQLADETIKLENGENFTADVSQIKTQEQYNKYKEAYIQKLAELKGVDTTDSVKMHEIVSEAEEFLNGKGFLSSYEEMNKTIRKYESSETDEGKALAEEIKKATNGLSSKEIEMAAKVEFNKFSTEEAIRNQIEFMQAELDSNELKAKVNVYSSAQDLLKEDMSEEDWAKLQNESGITWGQNGAISFKDFMRMDYEAQKEYLENQEIVERENYNKQLESEIQHLEESAKEAAAEGNTTAQREFQRRKEEKEVELLISQKDMEQDEERDWEQATEKYDLDLEETKAYAEHLEETYDLASEKAEELAIDNMRLNKGVETLSDTFENYEGALANVSDPQHAIAVKKLREGMSDLLSLDLDVLSDEFFDNAKNIELMKKAAEGDADAIEELREKAAEDILFDNSELKAKSEEISNLIDQFQTEDLEIGATMDNSQAMQALAELLIASGTSVEDIQNSFDSLGWTPEVEYKTFKAGSFTQDGSYVETDDGQRYYVGSGVKVEAGVEIPVFKTKNGKTPIVNATYRGKASSGLKDSTSDGGSGSDSGDPKVLEDEIERYHEIKELIDDIKNAYDHLSSAADRAFGQKKLDLIEQQIAKQEELIEAQDIYLSQLEESLSKDKTDLMQYGASFDEQGRITNYDEMMAVNVEAYNAQLTDEADKAYQEFLDSISKYEETLNEYEEAQYEKIEQIWEKIDLELSKVTYTVEVKLELNEDSIAYIEYQIERLGESATDATSKIGYLTQALGETFENIETYQQGIRDTLSVSGFTEEEIEAVLSGGDISAIIENKELTEEQISTLREYRDGLYESMEAAEEYRDQVIENLTTAFEDLNEEMAKGVDAIAHYKEMMTGYKDIIDLVGADNLGVSEELLANMQQTNVDLAMNSVSAAKSVFDTRQKELKAAQAELQKAQANGDEETIEIWQDRVDEIIESVREAESDLQSTWQDGLQTATDAFTATVEQVQKAFEDAMAGIFGSFDALSQAFEQAKTVDELYLEDYQKIYELSKLNRNIMKSIDETDNVSAKAKLRDLQEEINELQQSNTEMTQYEVEKLQAKYDLRLAEIALEEAQNAKSQVRMQRDSEGNWGYVYTADQSKVENAEQNYEDKLYNYQNKVQEYMNTAQEQIMAIPQQLSQALAEIMQDTTLTQEEQEKRIAETMKHYQTLYNHWIKQLDISTADAKQIYNIDWANYSNLTGYKISANEEWIDSWDETLYAQLTGFETLEEAQGAFNEASSILLENLVQAWENWQVNIARICEQAGVNVKDFGKAVETYMGKAKEASEIAADSVESVGEAGATAFEQLAQASGDWLTSYSTIMDGYRTQNDLTIASIGNLINQYSNLDSQLSTTLSHFQAVEQAALAAQAAVDLANSGGNTVGNIVDSQISGDDPDGSNDVKTIYGNNKFSEKQLEATSVYTSGTKSKWATDSQNNLYYETSRKGWYVKAIDLKTNGIGYEGGRYNGLKPRTILYYLGDNIDFEWTVGGVHTSSGTSILPSFDTGGYTGSWDSSGRVAMLHQKEIVLNATDTENFLAAVDIVREISSMIDLKAISQTSALSNLSSASITPGAQTIEQEVTIHAEFPNATNHLEIEQAFDTLINRASQFANRKN